LPFKGRPASVIFQPAGYAAGKSCQLCDRAGTNGWQAQRQKCALRLKMQGLFTAQLLGAIDDRLQAHLLSGMRFIGGKDGIDGL
jgi:hypothetical protein